MRVRMVGVAVVAAVSACVLPAKHAQQAPRAERAGDAYVEVSGAWVRVRDSGGGHAVRGRTPVVLVHGYGSRLESWAAVQPLLEGNRRVVSYDQRGFGMSERTRGDYGPVPHAADLRKLVDQLHVEKPLLVGHSYGGGVVLQAALDDPERYAGVVLVDAFAMDEQVPPAFRWARVPLLGEFIFATQFKEVVGEKYILAFSDRQRFASAEAIDEFRGNMLKEGALYTSLAVVRGMDYARAEPRYRDIKLPMAIIWGEDDRVTPLTAGKELAAALDAPQMTILERCGHVPLWERPRAVVETIEHLLARMENTPRVARARTSPSADPGSATP